MLVSKKSDKFCDNLWEIDFKSEANGGIDIESLPFEGYKKVAPNQHALFGRNGKFLFLKNESDLHPLNSIIFRRLANAERLPLIMNFYDPAIHLKYKKDLDNILRPNTLSQFGEILTVDIDKFWNKIKTANSEVCLFEELTQLIIDKQLEFFFNYKSDAKTLGNLAFYEDYFTLGLYLREFQDLEDYYSDQKFIAAKNKYNHLYEKIIKDEKKSVFQEFYKKMIHDGYNDHYIFSQFYNLSTAGSANIAKFFLYLLCILKENNLEELFKKKYTHEHILFADVGIILSELYRLIPFIQNQVVCPFILRIAHKKINIDISNTINKGDEVFYYNVLENINSEISEPLKFKPFRLSNPKKGKSSITFGTGTHRCSGASLTDLWMHHLLVSFIKSGVGINNKCSLQYETYHHKFEIIKKLIFKFIP